MANTIILAKRPDLVIKLEKYGILPPCKKGGSVYNGCAKKWAKEGKVPYNTPVYQAMAERLPAGWEELTVAEMDQLLDQLQTTIEERKKARLDTPNLGDQMMLKNLAKVAFITLSTVSALIVEAGLGVLPDSDEAEQAEARMFSFEMFLHLLIGTNVLPDTLREITRTMNTTEENQQCISEVLTTAAILFAIFSASQGDLDRLQHLITSFRSHISEGLNTTEHFVSNGLKTGKIAGDKAEGLALYLQQTRMALDKDDFEGFYDAISGALGLLEITPEAFLGDQKHIEVLAKQLQRALTTGMDDETNKLTAISQAL